MKLSTTVDERSCTSYLPHGQGHTRLRWGLNLGWLAGWCVCAQQCTGLFFLVLLLASVADCARARAGKVQ